MFSMIFVVDDDTYLEETSTSNISFKKHLEGKGIHFSLLQQALNSSLNFLHNRSVLIKLKCLRFTKLIHCSARVVGHIISTIEGKVVHQRLFPYTLLSMCLSQSNTTYILALELACPAPSAIMAACPLTRCFARFSWTKVQTRRGQKGNLLHMQMNMLN